MELIKQLMFGKRIEKATKIIYCKMTVPDKDRSSGDRVVESAKYSLEHGKLTGWEKTCPGHCPTQPVTQEKATETHLKTLEPKWLASQSVSSSLSPALL